MWQRRNCAHCDAEAIASPLNIGGVFVARFVNVSEHFRKANEFSTARFE
jgi:hypothetical protein